MAIVIDAESKTVTLSVGDILHDEISYKIGFSGISSLRRMWVGQGIHARYQQDQMEAISSYRREVPVSWSFPLSGYTVTLQGRIDGLYDLDKHAIVVEEIKSLHFSRDLERFFRGEMGEIYRRQVSLYGWLWSQLNEKSVNCRLILIDVVSGEERVEEVSADFSRVEAFVRGRVSRILRNYEKQERERKKKSERAEELSFPHDRYRPFQGEMSEAVSRTLEERRHLLIDAPTGIGKTAATIYPSIRFALKNGLKLFFLTAKTLQQEMAVETLKAINKDGQFKSLQIRSKAKMCANSEIICHEDFCPYAKDYGEKLKSSATDEKLLSAFNHIEPDSIYSAAVADKVCPFEITLELTRRVDAVVCDYNYIFEPRVSLRDTGEGLGLADTIVIIDEAHNLVDRGRDYYSPSLHTDSIKRARDSLTYLASDFSEVLQNAVDLLESELVAMAEKEYGEHEGGGEIEPPSISFMEHLLAMEAHVPDYIALQHERGLRRGEDPFLDLYFTLVRLATLQAEEGEEFVWVITKDSDTVELKLLCLDPSSFIGAVIDQTWSTIAQSATLTPFSFYQSLLGFPQDKTDSETFPSPFPGENRLVMVVPTVNTTYKHRKMGAPELSDLLHRMGNSIKGNCLILLPSYVYLNLVRESWPTGGKRCLVQEAEMDLTARLKIVRTMKQSREDLLLFGVSGGMYAEGIDYPGEMLKGVFIVSPSLPAVGLEQTLLKNYYDEHYESGFSFAYLIPGMRRVVQAAGRVIRSEMDRGVIVLICKRFSDSRYTRYFPEYWYSKSPEELIDADPVQRIKMFFGGEDGS